MDSYIPLPPVSEQSCPDRRLQRSQNSHLALRYQLQHSCQQGGIEALVLADEEGLSVAFAGDDAICAELAAMAPLMAKSTLCPVLSIADSEICIRPFVLYQRQLFLICLGGGMARDALLQHTVRGLQRILTSN